MAAQLARALEEWYCNSFTDLIDKMLLWDWNVANKDFWSQLAKSLHSQKVSAIRAGKMHKKMASILVPGKMSWGTTTSPSRSAKCELKRLGHRVQTLSRQCGAPTRMFGICCGQGERL